MQFYCIAMDLLYLLVCIKLRVYQFVSHNLKHSILLWSPISFSTTFAGHRGSWQRMLRNHQLICEKGVCRRCKPWCHGHWLNISNHNCSILFPRKNHWKTLWKPKHAKTVATFQVWQYSPFFTYFLWGLNDPFWPRSFLQASAQFVSEAFEDHRLKVMLPVCSKGAVLWLVNIGIIWVCLKIG